MTNQGEKQGGWNPCESSSNGRWKEGQYMTRMTAYLHVLRLGYSRRLRALILLQVHLIECKAGTESIMRLGIFLGLVLSPIGGIV
jgi:hypothetical protein